MRLKNRIVMPAMGTGCGTRDGQVTQRTIDYVVLATGASHNAWLASALEGKGHEVYLAGDCRKPDGIRQAIHDGARVSRAI